MPGKSVEVFEHVGKAGGTMLRRMLDTAIDGVPWLPGARQAAMSALEKHGEHAAAIESCVLSHIALAGGQGFVTNLGGLVALPVSLPSNLTGIAMIQLRLVACIAHLRGYDIDDSRVRSAIMMCLLGDGLLGKVAAGDLPGSPLVVATAPMFNTKLDQKISEAVLKALVAQVGGNKLASVVAKRIPLIGGGVGAVSDAWNTYQLASYTKTMLVDRRPRLSAGLSSPQSPTD